MTVRPGEVWGADITFTDGAGTKIRPVLVLWLDGADAIVAVITTAAPRSKSDVALQDWAGAGLRHPSTVRLARLDCLEQSLLRYRSGKFVPLDAAQIKDTWVKSVKPQF